MQTTRSSVLANFPELPCQQDFGDAHVIRSSLASTFSVNALGILVPLARTRHRLPAVHVSKLSAKLCNILPISTS